METNLGKPNTPVNVGAQPTSAAVVQPTTTQVVKTAQAAEQQKQAQTFQPESKGWQGLVSKVAALSPFSPTRQLDRAKKDPQIQGWSSGGKTKPPVPTLAEMMPEVDMSAQQTMANPFGTAPAPENYRNGIEWASANAAYESYGKYKQNPVETDWYMLNQLMMVQAEERTSMV